MLRGIVLHIGHTPDHVRSVPDMKQAVRKQTPVPYSPSAAGRRAPRAPTPTGLHGRPSVVLLPPVAWSGVDMMAELGRVAADRRSGRLRERVV